MVDVAPNSPSSLSGEKDRSGGNGPADWRGRQVLRTIGPEPKGCHRDGGERMFSRRGEATPQDLWGRIRNAIRRTSDSSCERMSRQRLSLISGCCGTGAARPVAGLA